MKKRVVSLLFSVLVLPVFVTTLFAHESLQNIAPGWNLPAAYFRFAAFNSIYFKNEIVKNPDEIKRTESFRHVQSGFQLAYAVSSRLQVEYKQFLYQDHHLGDKNYNFPDDAILKIKYAALSPLNSHFRFGASLSSRFPFAREHNGIMEPFTADHIGFGLTGHLSYSPDLLLPENAFNMHFNLGYRNFANTGEAVTNAFGETAEVLAPTQAMKYGAALVFPSSAFKLCLEFFGQTFINQPPETAFGRENFLYFSPAVTFSVLGNLNLRLGADLRMSSNQNFDFTQANNGMSTTFEIATYPAWRLTAGFNIEIPLRNPGSLRGIDPLPVSVDSTASTTSTVDSTQTEKKRYEDEVTRRSRIKRELTQKNLEKLKNERMERDRLLRSLRKKLEGKKQKKTEEKPRKDE